MSTGTVDRSGFVGNSTSASTGTVNRRGFIGNSTSMPSISSSMWAHLIGGRSIVALFSKRHTKQITTVVSSIQPIMSSLLINFVILKNRWRGKAAITILLTKWRIRLMPIARRKIFTLGIQWSLLTMIIWLLLNEESGWYPWWEEKPESWCFSMEEVIGNHWDT